MVNINARDVSIGVVAGGDASVGGSVTNTQSPVDSARQGLDKLLELLGKSPNGELAEGKRLAEEAKKNTDPVSIQKVVSWMKGIKDLGAYALSATSSYEQIFHVLEATAKHWSS